jgi:regulator of sigma E protease
MLIINAIKIIFLLGFLVLIHEGGHFLAAKTFGVNVEEFSIGFGPIIFSKQKNNTLYRIGAIPFGGYVRMTGENERSEAEGAFNKASILHRILIVAAGGVVNIVFALIAFFILSLFYRLEVEYSIWDKIVFAFKNTIGFILSMIESLKLLFTGKIGLDQMTGPVGISEIVVNTNGFFNFIHLLCLVSLSLGVTNLLPFPALDGGRIVLLIIEGIRGKALSEEIEMKIQSMGFLLLIMIAFYVTYQDILRLF